MLKKKILLLLLPLLLLALPLVSALENDSLYYNASLLVNWDNTLTEDNSSFASTSGSVVGNPSLGADTVCGPQAVTWDGAGDDKIAWLGTEDAFREMINFTYCIWFKNPSGGTLEVLGAKHGPTGNGRWFFSYRDAGGENALNLLFGSDSKQVIFNSLGRLEENNPQFLCAGVNATGDGAAGAIGWVAINGSVMMTATELGTNYNAPDPGFFNITIGENQPATSGSLSGTTGQAYLFNRTLTTSEMLALYNDGSCTQLTSVTPPPPEPIVPNLYNNITNNSIPKENDVVMFNITINTTGNENISGFIFSWDNGTGTFINDSFVSLQSFQTNLTLVSVNKTIFNESGIIVQWQWYRFGTIGSGGGGVTLVN